MESNLGGRQWKNEGNLNISCFLGTICWRYGLWFGLKGVDCSKWDHSICRCECAQFLSLLGTLCYAWVPRSFGEVDGCRLMLAYPITTLGGKRCDLSAETLFITCWERSIYMCYDALEWWIRTVTEKWSVWVPAIGQTDYHYAVWVILYKPICHTEKVSHVIWFIAWNGLGEIYLDFQPQAQK